MSALQWALLILSVAIVIAVVAISRRDRSPLPRREAPTPPDVDAADELFDPPAPTRDEQLDIFSQPPQPVPPIAVTPPPVAVPPPPRPVAAPEREIAVPPSPSPAPEASPLTAAQYDEFGVGRARRRSAPGLGGFSNEDESEPAAAEPASDPLPVVTPAWLRAPVPKAPPAVQSELFDGGGE